VRFLVLIRRGRRFMPWFRTLAGILLDSGFYQSSWRRRLRRELRCPLGRPRDSEPSFLIAEYQDFGPHTTGVWIDGVFSFSPHLSSSAESLIVFVQTNVGNPNIKKVTVRGSATGINTLKGKIGSLIPLIESVRHYGSNELVYLPRLSELRSGLCTLGSVALRTLTNLLNKQIGISDRVRVGILYIVLELAQ
jgi:hypothetical protein